MPHLRSYGDLNQDRNFKSLINDVVGLQKLNLVPWGTSAPSPDQIFSDLSNGSQTVHAVTWHILLSAAKEMGAKVAMDKSLDSVLFAERL